VLGRGVVEDKVDAQVHAAQMHRRGQPLEVGHRADAGVDFAVVGHRVPAVVLALPRPQQRHQVQVGDAELGQVVQPVDDTVERAAEAVDVAAVADLPGPLEPARVDLPRPVADPQPFRPG
jgi:hypothetical protein